MKRIETLLKMSKDFSNFSFDTGINGIKDLYKMDLDTIIDQCLDRLAPNRPKVAL